MGLKVKDNLSILANLGKRWHFEHPPIYSLLEICSCLSENHNFMSLTF